MRALAATVRAAVLLTAAGAPLLVPRPAEAIVGGTPDPGDPAVVHIAERTCSGTLVAPRVVLTAAHCQGASGDGVAFADGTTVSAAAFHAHPAWNPSSLDNDIAIYVLASASAIPPVPLSRTPFDDSFIGRIVRIVGWGTAGDAGAGTLRTGQTTISAYLATTFVDDAHPAATCEGDSGGPALLATPSGEVVAGVTSRGDQACGAFGVKTRVDAYVDDFLAPAIDATTPGSQPTGAPCDFDAACASHACVAAVDSTLVHYCSAACTGDGACPRPMHCVNGMCRYPPPSPGALGAACDLDGDCAGDLCVERAAGGARTCSILCEASAPAPCPGGYVCETTSDPATNACFAPPASNSASAGGGCTIGPWRRFDAVASMSLLSLVALARWRRRGRHHDQ